MSEIIYIFDSRKDINRSSDSSKLVVQKEVNLEKKENLEYKKVIIAGIANAGKTAIITFLLNKNLNIDRVKNLQPTKSIQCNYIILNNLKYFIWDLGGASFYRENYLEKKGYIFSEVDEFIFVIDVMDSEVLIEAINYLAKLIHKFDLNQIRTGKNLVLKFFILFHKSDPEVINSEIYRKNCEFLTREIMSLNIPLSYEIYKTSIYNFQDNNPKILENNPKIEGIGSFIVKLLSLPEIM